MIRALTTRPDRTAATRPAPRCSTVTVVSWALPPKTRAAPITADALPACSDTTVTPSIRPKDTTPGETAAMSLAASRNRDRWMVGAGAERAVLVMARRSPSARGGPWRNPGGLVEVVPR
jgi:hypothetical protein